MHPRSTRPAPAGSPALATLPPEADRNRATSGLSDAGTLGKKMKPSIRQATKNDCEAVASVLQEATRWLSEKNMPMWSLDAFTPEKIEKEISEFYVAGYSDGIAGVLKLQLEDAAFWRDLPGGDAIFVHRLAVRRGYARSGLSNALLDFAVRKATSLGKKCLRLDCAADRPKLRRVYEEYGFVYHSDLHVPLFHVARYEYPIKTEPNLSLQPTVPRGRG